MASVEGIFADQQKFALDANTRSQQFVDALLGLVQTDDDAAFTFIAGDFAASDHVGNAESRLLNFRPSTFIIPTIGGTPPTIADPSFPTLPNILIPDFNANAPTLNFPQPPDATLPDAPLAPTVNDVPIPDEPTLDFPVAPILAGLDFPQSPALDLPTFQSTLPIDDLVVPSFSFNFAEQPYVSENLEALKIKLFNDLIDGGYGIETADEIALFERARERELELARTEVDELYAETASRGFPLPTGDLNISIQRATQKVADKMSSVSREIALKRADLYVENRKFTFGQVREVEQILLNYNNLVNERALNAQKALIEMSIAIFNASVSRYNARLETYRAEAVVFEAKVRAALARVEIFRTEMEAVRIRSDVQKNQIEIYRAQLSAVNILVEVFKTRMEAAAIRAQVERLKIEAFRSLVDAFTSQVQAKVAQFNMFTSQIQGEVARVAAFEAEARAYDSIIQGKRAAVDANIAKVRLVVDESAQKVNIFQARIQAFQAQIQAQTSQVDALLKKYTGDVQLYGATATALVEAFRLQQQFTAQQIEAFRANTNVSIENARNHTQAFVGVLNAKIGGSNVAAEYYKALVAGAQGALMALASFTTST